MPIDPNDALLSPGEEQAPSAREKRPGQAVDPFRIRRALLSGWKLLAVSLVVGLVLGYVVAKFALVSPFESFALLKYEGIAKIEGVPESEEGRIGAAAEALSLPPVLREIRARFGFDGDLLTLEKQIDYTIDHQSNVIIIQVADESAEGAARFAQTVTAVFLEYQEQQHAKRIQDEIERVNTRISGAEHEAESARAAYNKFRKDHGIADLTAERGGSQDSATRLTAQAELAVSDIHALEARIQALEKELAKTPKMQTVTTTDSPVRAEYSRLQAELATARSTLSAEHPRVQALEEQVNSVGQQLKATGGGVQSSALGPNVGYLELEQQLRTARADLQGLREQQKGLTELSSEAKSRVEKFSEIEGEASALSSALKMNEDLLNELRGIKARLEDAWRRPSSGFVVLDPGSVPEYAERARAKYLVFGGIAGLSVLLALLFVFGREFRGLRAITPSEIAYWGNGPVVASTTWPVEPLALDELVADLDDYAPDARGGLLVLAGQPRHGDLARLLTERLNDDWVSTVHVRHPEQPRPTQPRGPITTPAPGVGYPLATRQSQSTALAPVRRPPAAVAMVTTTGPQNLQIEAWEGPSEGQGLRRAARLADRVLILVESGAMSALELNAMRTRLGRDRGIGYVVTGLTTALASLPDRCGDVETFWRATGPTQGQACDRN